MKICFWNTEHLSPHLEAAAQREKERLALVNQGIQNQRSRGKGLPPSRPVTRFATSSAPQGRGKGTTYSRATSSGTQQVDRETTKEVARRRQYNQVETKANRLRAKALLAQDLSASGHVFFCEVMRDKPGAEAPYAAAPGPHTLCYLYYRGGAVTPFMGFATAMAGALPATHGVFVDRLPKVVEIRNSASIDVLFCFWHGPSGGNGSHVVDMYRRLEGIGRPFVLFGDLNAEPSKVRARGLSATATILEPSEGTRISHKKIDYAITNDHTLFHPAVRPLNTDTGMAIRNRVGSDHMVMYLEMV